MVIRLRLIMALSCLIVFTNEIQAATKTASARRPNILLCISDDQSYAHTSANGDQVVKTPGFDRVATEGIRFTHAYCDAPSCAPSRNAILTGQPIWRLEEGGNIHCTLPAKFAVYPRLLEKAGYCIGATGKSWGPGKLELGGRLEHPVGKLFQKEYDQAEFGKMGVTRAMKPIAYARNFSDFLDEKPIDQPFCFWLGTSEPHRWYVKGSGAKAGMNPASVKVPKMFPDHPVVRNDLLDYYLEVMHFDRHVKMAIELLEARGELENTLIVVTSDHGMPFPRAKASQYDWGTRVPLAIRWPAGIDSPGRICDSFVNLSDLAPTFLAAAGVEIPEMMIARSLLPVFGSSDAKHQTQAYTAMERHDGCRKGGKGFPCRAIRTKDYLYIHNFEPARWPSGSPDRAHCARDIPYGEVSNCPTKSLMMARKGLSDADRHLYQLSFGKRPRHELYRLRDDPDQIVNLAYVPEFESKRIELMTRLFDHLKATGDPRLTGAPALWDYYPYTGVRHNKHWSVEPMPESLKMLINKK